VGDRTTGEDRSNMQISKIRPSETGKEVLGVAEVEVAKKGESIRERGRTGRKEDRKVSGI